MIRHDFLVSRTIGPGTPAISGGQAVSGELPLEQLFYNAGGQRRSGISRKWDLNRHSGPVRKIIPWQASSEAASLRVAFGLPSAAIIPNAHLNATSGEEKQKVLKKAIDSRNEAWNS
ncbi:MAG: hypothetical protein ACLQU1_31695 [Bryobacteraceae bacterium]